MIDDSHFELLEVKGDEFFSIKIVADNKWKGLVYNYGAVKVSIEDKDLESEHVMLSFDFHIQNKDKEETKRLENDTELGTYVGEILTYIITDFVEKGDYEFAK